MPNHINYMTSNALAPMCSTYEQNGELTLSTLYINISYFSKGVKGKSEKGREVRIYHATSVQVLNTTTTLLLFSYRSFSYASYTIPPYPCNRCIISSAIIN